MLNAAQFEGKYYAIPGINKYSPNRVLVARGDLMDKLEIDNLNTIDDIDAFLMGVADLNKKKETNIVPYNAKGGAPWMIFSMWASDWGWAAPGSLSFGGHYYYSVFDDNRELFIAVDKPEVKEYSLTVKKWYDAGVFSKSVLSNNTTAEEAYKNGKSAFAWTSSPSSANVLYNDLKKIPGADKWDTRFYSMYSKLQKVYGFMNSATAISATSNQKEASLKVINAVYEDETLYNLIMYGFEGKHYELNEAGEFTRLSENYSAPSMGVTNQEYEFPTKYDYAYALDLVDEMNNIAIYEPLVNLPTITDDDIAGANVKLNDVFAEYSTPRMYGAVTNVDAAIKKEREALKVAGIDKVIKRVQKHMDDYVASHPEANEDFKKTRAEVLEYKKQNPNKVNPKDYK
jgi:putative aldouronate transport system substrate-binding protein